MLGKHDVIDGHQGVFIIEEGAHIAINPHGGLPHGSEIVPKIGRKIQDTLNLPLLHQLFGLFHGRAAGGDLRLPRGIDLTDIAAARAAVSHIDHGKGRIFQDTVDIDNVIEQRIKHTGHKEDQHDTSIREDSFEFTGGYFPGIFQPT